MIHLLVSLGADVHRKDNKGRTGNPNTFKLTKTFTSYKIHQMKGILHQHYKLCTMKINDNSMKRVNLLLLSCSNYSAELVSFMETNNNVAI